jgi:hypothetical protein
MGAAAESAFAPESGCGCAEGGVDGFFVHDGGGLAAGEERKEFPAVGRDEAGIDFLHFDQLYVEALPGIFED